MKPTDMRPRFEELCAGHAIGDLTSEEVRELATLCKQLDASPDASLGLLAAALHVIALEHTADILPPHLAARLHQWADETHIIRPQPSTWRKLAVHPFTGWAAAAVVLLASLLATQDPQPQPPTQALAPEQAGQALRTSAPDLIESKFEGIGTFAQAQGTVIWSDSQQQGFMFLSGIPANNPSLAQYQLWIVDPERDADSPIDGGVFDIPGDVSFAVIPITAKLAVNNPRAFVITLEQPGGVVISKQEQVVAIARI